MKSKRLSTHRASHFAWASMLSLSAIFLGATAAGATDNSICSQLGDRVGIYLVNGGQIKTLHAGSQKAKWSVGSSLYFVVAENDGRPETVDHFRVVTTGGPRAHKNDLEIGLDRTAAHSPCNSKILGLFARFGSEKHRETTVTKYNKRLNPKYKDIDNRLNEWHFQWNNAASLQAREKCDYTADHTPAFEDDGGDRPTDSGFIGAAVAANIIPANAATSNIESVRMVLVHRKENDTSCLAVSLKANATPETTRIQRLRFRNKGARFSGEGTVIRWIP